MIELHDLVVRLGKFILDGIDLTVGNGEFLVLLGPTGAGKTVLLESIAGLRPVHSGRIVLGGREITRAKPETRGVGICYQDYALFPHMTARENILYGIAVRGGKSTSENRRTFEALVEMLGIGHTLDRLPQTLSGGEKQRVAVARALIVRPEVLLLDEPLSALDAGIRQAIQRELKMIHASVATTTMMVTHDFGEAFALAERVGVINGGRLVQVGPVEEVFERPNCPFVARFVGMKNVLRVCPGDADSLAGIWQALDGPPEGGYLGVRPEHVFLSDDRGRDAFRLSGTVECIDRQPAHCEVTLASSGREFRTYLMLDSPASMGLREGLEVRFGFERENVALIAPPRCPAEE